MTEPSGKRFRVVNKEGDEVAVVEDRTEEVGIGKEPCGVVAVSAKVLKELGMTAEEYAETLRKAFLGE